MAPLKLGEKARLTIRIGVSNLDQLRLSLPVECKYVRVSDGKLCAIGNVVAVPISIETGKLLRRIPPILIEAIAKSTVNPTAVEFETSEVGEDC